ncbi:hypothetical protein [Schaedlerella arabinosiphila]|nr:hypothetical protein [Schaedlerella arabinosiphila]
MNAAMGWMPFALSPRKIIIFLDFYMVIMHVFNPFIPFEVCKLSSFHFPIRLVIFIMPPGSGVGVPYPKDIKIKKSYQAYPMAPVPLHPFQKTLPRAFYSSIISSGFTSRTLASLPEIYHQKQNFYFVYLHLLTFVLVKLTNTIHILVYSPILSRQTVTVHGPTGREL